MGAWVAGYVGLAIVYALSALVGIIVLARWFGRPLPTRFWPLAACTLFFIFLTQHPFPDRALMPCPHPAGRPDLRLFGYVQDIRAAQATGQGLRGLFQNLTLMSMLMNFVICAGIGFLSARAGIAFRTTTLLALGMTTLVELSQLTGLFGVFPCAYREFSLDDMVLNVTGAMVGAAIVMVFPGLVSKR